MTFIPRTGEVPVRKGETIRHYHGADVAACLHDWGGYNGRGKSFDRAMELLDSAVAKFGPVRETFWIDQYAVVTFGTSDIARMGIHRTFAHTKGKVRDDLAAGPGGDWFRLTYPDFIERGAPTATGRFLYDDGDHCDWCHLQIPLAHSGECPNCGTEIAA